MSENELSGHKLWNVREVSAAYFPTAREYFAAAALNGLLAGRGTSLGSPLAAETAIRYADSMIASLGK